MDDFSRFWAVYPRRVAKLDAQKAWRQMAPPIDQVLATLAWQIEQWDDLKYVPYPASWLRSGRWEDEQPVQLAPKAQAFSPAAASVLRMVGGQR